jgi:hypothetical protein
MVDFTPRETTTVTIGLKSGWGSEPFWTTGRGETSLATPEFITFLVSSVVLKILLNSRQIIWFKR